MHKPLENEFLYVIPIEKLCKKVLYSRYNSFSILKSESDVVIFTVLVSTSSLFAVFTFIIKTEKNSMGE